MTNSRVDDPNLETRLRKFNRKERYWVIKRLLGDGTKSLNQELLDCLNGKLGARKGFEKVPPEAWWAMDYHIDWLCAALVGDQTPDGRPPQNSADLATGQATDRYILGNQQDIDIVIANGKQIILIEAKTFGDWSKDQLQSKLSRIATLKTMPQLKRQNIKIWFVLMSENKPKKINKDMEGKLESINGVRKPIWINLGIPVDLEFDRVERCDEARRSNKDKGYWTIKPVGRKSAKT